jgi:hypothetical protein
MQAFLKFKSGLKYMFWTFKLGFDVDILAFLAWQLFCLAPFYKIWVIFSNLLVTLSDERMSKQKN